MNNATLLSTFTLLFVAEMGDKTQLMAMTLAHRYRLLPVLIGTFSAFLALNALAVLLGDAVAGWVPRDIVLAVAGGLFLFFGAHAWSAAEDADGSLPELHGRWIWLLSFSLIFMAELGDKSQLTLVALAARSGDAWAAFIGGSVALCLVSLLGMLVGRTLLQRLSARWVHRAAALLFLGFGAWSLGIVLAGLAGW